MSRSFIIGGLCAPLMPDVRWLTLAEIRMLEQEQQLIYSLTQLSDCLRGFDKWWPLELQRVAGEASVLFRGNSDLAEKFDFVSTHNYSTGSMGSLNDGVVPDGCKSQQRELYKSINELLRLYWKELGREWHDYSTFNLLCEGAKVCLIPGKVIFCNSVYSAEVLPEEEHLERPWVVLRCEGPDITNMPTYTVRRDNTFRSARHEALKTID